MPRWRKSEKSLKTLAADLHEKWAYPPSVRRISAVVEAPTLRADGTVLSAPGYDARSQLLFLPSCQFPEVPTAPTREQGLAAIAELLDVVCDFPFETDAYRSAWLAFVLTLVARPAIAGACPMFLFDAAAASSGKTMLVDVAAAIATGRDAPHSTLPTSEDGIKKVVTTALVEGKQLYLFDNVDTELKSPPWTLC